MLVSSRKIGFGGVVTWISQSEKEAEFEQKLADAQLRPGPQGPLPAGVDPLDQQLRRLAGLRVDGLLTGEEFEQRRRKLLK